MGKETLEVRLGEPGDLVQTSGEEGRRHDPGRMDGIPLSWTEVLQWTGLGCSLFFFFFWFQKNTVIFHKNVVCVLT